VIRRGDWRRELAKTCHGAIDGAGIFERQGKLVEVRNLAGIAWRSSACYDFSGGVCRLSKAMKQACWAWNAGRRTKQSHCYTFIRLSGLCVKRWGHDMCAGKNFRGRKADVDALCQATLWVGQRRTTNHRGRASHEKWLTELFQAMPSGARPNELDFEVEESRGSHHDTMDVAIWHAFRPVIDEIYQKWFKTWILNTFRVALLPPFSRPRCYHLMAPSPAAAAARSLFRFSSLMPRIRGSPDRKRRLVGFLKCGADTLY